MQNGAQMKESKCAKDILKCANEKRCLQDIRKKIYICEEKKRGTQKIHLHLIEMVLFSTHNLKKSHNECTVLYYTWSSWWFDLVLGVMKQSYLVPHG